MGKDDKSTVWEELYKIRFWIAIAATLVSTLVYVLLWLSNRPKGSWWVSLPTVGSEYLMNLITNFVPTFLIIVVGYVLRRKLQVIKSKEERHALVTEITEEIQLVVAGELQSTQQKIDEVLEHAELGRTVHASGIAGITSDWTEFADFRGPFGQRLHKRIEAIPLQADKPSATWYIVTIEPKGLMSSWLGLIKQTVETKGVDVKWVCHARKSVEQDEALQAEWQWIRSRIPRWEQRADPESLSMLETSIKVLHHRAKESHDEIQAMDIDYQRHAGHWEFYESKVPHFYMAFLSVPGKYDPNLKQAPVGTFGFVHLYPKFAQGHCTRPALYLEAPGKILDYYYWSTVQLFDEGVKRGYLWRTWPPETQP